MPPSLRRAALVMLAVLVVTSPGRPAAGETKIHFPSLDPAATMLDGYLFKPDKEGRHPAVVFLHGCGGLLNRWGDVEARESDWADRLTERGYVVLMVDSFSPRRQGSMCAPQNFRDEVYLARPKDAYGALRWLQAQSFVRADRVFLMGWSEGGGIVLFAIRKESLGRPKELGAGDFRAAIAFYPASCRESAHKVAWTSTIPLLVLVGASDNWTPAEPCRALVEGAAARGSPAEMRIYPGAYHDFDWPHMMLRANEAFRTRAGVVPITGTNPAARADALERVPAFLGRHLEE